MPNARCARSNDGRADKSLTGIRCPPVHDCWDRFAGCVAAAAPAAAAHAAAAAALLLHHDVQSNIARHKSQRP